MNAKYIRNRRTAERLIRENGASFDWRKTTEVVIDPVTEEPVGEPYLLQKVWAVILPPNGNPDQYRGDNGTLDLSKVRRVLVSTQGLKYNPEPLHQIFYKGEWWLFENSSELAPDGETDILFKGLIRRA